MLLVGVFGKVSILFSIYLNLSLSPYVLCICQGLCFTIASRSVPGSPRIEFPHNVPGELKKTKQWELRNASLSLLNHASVFIETFLGHLSFG